MSSPPDQQMSLIDRADFRSFKQLPVSRVHMHPGDSGRFKILAKIISVNVLMTDHTLQSGKVPEIGHKIPLLPIVDVRIGNWKWGQPPMHLGAYHDTHRRNDILIGELHPQLLPL